uniref:Mab-21 domain-containing protein n=1 Tax=Caenorhabditis japonica TaxID=281687 RepID=A0A8R1I3I5_CAEJA
MGVFNFVDDGTIQGCAVLKLSDGRKRSMSLWVEFITASGYLSARKIRHRFQNIVAQVLQTPKFSDYCKLMQDNTDVRVRVDDKYTVQITCAFRCNGIWPRSASHWPLAGLPWPNAGLASQTKAEGFDLTSRETAVTQNNPNKQASSMEADAWAMKMHGAESMLLTGGRRKTLSILKCLRDAHMEFPGTPVTNYILKTLVLYECEKHCSEQEGGISEQCNASENQVFVGNVVHVISQLADSLIMACGGLLPLLASATAPSNDMEIVDPCQQQLPISVAAGFLMRFARLVDTFVLASGVSFSELEQEKNMPAGGVLRQSLRISATVTVRHILASRIQQPDTPRYETTSTKKNQCIMEFVKEALENRSPDGLGNLEHLVQDSDINRIKGVVYRDMVEEIRQAQFLSLSVIYLVSVLMVSRYRDILEPPSSPSPFFNSTTSQKSENADGDSSSEKSSTENIANGKTVNGDHVSIENGKGAERNEENGEDEGQGDAGMEKEQIDMEEGIAAIKADMEMKRGDGNEYDKEELAKINQANKRRPSGMMPVQQTAERRAYLTTKLQTALETCAPLLREMMSDFRGYLQKTLVGTHGQEIMNDAKVLETLRNRNASVIELVMLLCSQEWQTSLQKHAGLAFIELVNEGRLMAHATRDHVLRVANEADFILNRLRAEDVSKHAQFENESRESLLARHEEYSRCDLLIVSGRLRDSLNAARLLEKMSAILSDPDDDKNSTQFWKLDVWEDDSRRRKRFVPNANGSRHEEANLPEGEKNEEPEMSEQERIREVLKVFVSQRQTAAGTNELVDESDIDKWAQEVDPTPSSREFFLFFSKFLE